jgi:hypothetical protein
VDPKAKLDLLLLPELVGTEADVVAPPGEELLGERGALVRRMRLLADEQDLAREALGAESLRAAASRETRAHDQDARRGHAAS